MALQSLLDRKRAAYKGRIGLLDPTGGGTGFLYLTQDVELDRDNWRLLRAIGRSSPKLFGSTRDMIREIQSGHLLLAYNMIGSYALEQQRRDRDFGVIIPNDYFLVASRIAAITKDAPHPAAAKLFLDFVLSREGEALMARHAMIPVRTHGSPPGPPVDPQAARAIRVGPGLLANLDQLTRAKFLGRWNRLIAR